MLFWLLRLATKGLVKAQSCMEDHTAMKYRAGNTVLYNTTLSIDETMNWNFWSLHGQTTMRALFPAKKRHACVDMYQHSS
jgi:hypothetical protein